MFEDDPELTLRLAESYYGSGRQLLAETIVVAFLGRQPANLAVLQLFWRHIQDGAVPAGLDAISAAAIEAGVDIQSVATNWIGAYVGAGDHASALRAARQCMTAAGLAGSNTIAGWSEFLAASASFVRLPYVLLNKLDDQLVAAGEIAQADGVLRRTIEAFPDDPSPTLKFAARLEARGDNAEALTLLRGLFERLPSQSVIALRLAALLTRRGDARGTIKVLAAAHKAGAKTEAVLAPWIAACLTARDYSGSRSAIEACAEPLGLTPLSKTWTWPQVLKRSRTLRATLPLDLYFRLETLAMASNNREDADEILEYAISAYPDLSEPVLRLAHRRYEDLGLGGGDAGLRKFLAAHPADGHVASHFASRLMSRLQFDEAYTVLARAIEAGAPFVELASKLLTTLLELGQIEKAEEIIRDALRSEKLAAADRWIAAPVLAASGKLDAADQLIDKSLAAMTEKAPARAAVRHMKEQLAIRLNTAAILKERTVKTPLKGVVALVTQRSPLMPIWLGLPMAELAGQGYASVVLDKSQIFDVPPSGDADIDALHGMLDVSQTRLAGEPAERPELRNEWTVDMARKTVSAQGFNMFPAIAARIGTAFRSYDVDFDDPAAQVLLHRYIAQCDAALTVCRRITDTVAARGLAVRFAGCMTHYPPAAVYKAWCEAQRSKTDMNYVAFDTANENYYSNLANTTTSGLSVANLTRHPDITSACHAIPERFESWRKRQTASADFGASSEKIAALDRANADHSAAARAMRARVMAHRLAGGRVIAMFGKMLYDVFMDTDVGPAHANMRDWINHTVRTLANSNTLLLIKPHPYEKRPEINRSKQYFADLVPRPQARNVCLLDHRWFNMNDMVDMIDLGVLWNGSAALELQSQGIPAVVCSDWGAKDVTMPLFRIRDRAHYEALLLDPTALEVTPDMRKQCAALISYLASDDIMIPYGYANMPVLRGIDAGAMAWNMDRVKTWLEQGDPHVSLIAERILNG
jgi:Tfp pilus assembly protein PilF